MPLPRFAGWLLTSRDSVAKVAPEKTMNPHRSSSICRFVDLGRVAYGEAMALQERLVAARKTGDAPDVLLLCEHPHVLTLGRNGNIANLRAPEPALRQMGVEFHRVNRGGDITYHGPGQMVAYPVLQLAEIRRDVVWYVRQLEEGMLRAGAAFGVAAFRVPGCTGVWAAPTPAADALEEKEKLGAIGVHISRWVTSHGLAYNVSTDLSYFDLIVPCGIAGCRSTSLEKLTGRRIPLQEFAPQLVTGFGQALGLRMVSAQREELNGWLAHSMNPAELEPAGQTRAT
jgi:lipoyl(octanoyl) transferase